jgi:hypothetical protein
MAEFGAGFMATLSHTTETIDADRAGDGPAVGPRRPRIDPAASE